MMLVVKAFMNVVFSSYNIWYRKVKLMLLQEYIYFKLSWHNKKRLNAFHIWNFDSIYWYIGIGKSCLKNKNVT